MARSLLRAQDRMLLFELVPEECERLGHEFARDVQVRIRAQDGYAGLKAVLPPPERRGLVLMDPPYEAPTEFTEVFKALKTAHQRWATGVYALWYPIKERMPVTRLHKRLAASGMRKVLCAEFLVYPEDTAFRLNGCGMVIVNPPWKLDDTLRGLLPRLLAALEPVAGRGQTTVSWLVPE
jgi:23S rRNA (adenine2030-N6)-methyltransferase